VRPVHSRSTFGCQPCGMQEVMATLSKGMRDKVPHVRLASLRAVLATMKLVDSSVRWPTCNASVARRGPFASCCPAVFLP